ncbi:hypothetical protein GCM10027093_52500 [Paraburkholderia jirisanensis]
MEDDRYSENASRDDFAKWVGGWLSELIPYRGAVFGIAEKCTLGVKILDTLAIDLPPLYLQQVTAHAEVGCPVLSHWLLVRRPQYVEAGAIGEPAALLRQFGLRNVLLHGHVDVQRAVASYFALFNVRDAAHAQWDTLADPIARRLHHAVLAWHDGPAVTGAAASAVATAETLTRAAGAGTPRGHAASALPLTPAEQGVFRWLREGKTNWEISRILNKSEWTVKTQVQQILRKLDAPSRRDVMAVYRHGAAGADAIEQAG